MDYERRNIKPSWNINEPDAPSTPQGVTTSANISRCTDITIMKLDEKTVGHCSFPSGGTCLAEGTYHVEAYNFKQGITYKWEIVSGTGASFITDSNGHPIDNVDTVVIRTTDNKDVVLVLKCTVTDGKGNQTSMTDTFTHSRVQL